MAKADVCHWWMGYLLASPIRRLVENPDKMLRAHLRPGMTVLEIGCAMGFFTIPSARLVGDGGKVVAVDLQPKMIASLVRRLKRRGLLDRVETRVCGESDLRVGDLEGRVDFATAIHVVHEVPDQERFFAQLLPTLKPGASLLFVEPRGHVAAEEMRLSTAAAVRAGFRVVEDRLESKRTCLLARSG